MRDHSVTTAGTARHADGTDSAAGLRAGSRVCQRVPDGSEGPLALGRAASLVAAAPSPHRRHSRALTASNDARGASVQPTATSQTSACPSGGSAGGPPAAVASSVRRGWGAVGSDLRPTTGHRPATELSNTEWNTRLAATAEVGHLDLRRERGQGHLSVTVVVERAGRSPWTGVKARDLPRRVDRLWAGLEPGVDLVALWLERSSLRHRGAPTGQWSAQERCWRARACVPCRDHAALRRQPDGRQRRRGRERDPSYAASGTRPTDARMW
jgi:hypothetical protein